MIAHVTAGLRSVLSGNRVVDCLMKSKCMFLRDELGGQHHHVHHGPMNHLEKATEETISCTLMDDAMEEQIGFNDPELVCPCGFDLGDRLTHDEQLFWHCMFRSFGSERGFDHEPRFYEFLRGGLVKQEQEFQWLREY